MLLPSTSPCIAVTSVRAFTDHGMRVCTVDLFWLHEEKHDRLYFSACIVSSTCAGLSVRKNAVLSIHISGKRIVPSLCSKRVLCHRLIVIHAGSISYMSGA
jgi:hypothetical protein